jgi:hypothetical protein
MFETIKPSFYSPHLGEHITVFTSKRGEVSAILFLTESITKAYVHFRRGLDFLNITDPFFVPIYDYLEKNGFPHLMNIRVLTDQEWIDLLTTGSCRIEKFEYQRLYEILREIKKDPERSVYLCPIEPRRFEKESFLIEDINFSVGFRPVSRDCTIRIPLFEIRSIEDSDSKVTIYLEGRLVYEFETDKCCLWRYFPLKTDQGS